MKKKVLIISIYYPPIASIASNRIESFTKYLDKSKFDIEVITLREGNSKELEVQDNVTIHRIENKSLFKRFKFDSKTNIIIHKLKVLWNIALQIVFDEYNPWKKSAKNLGFKLLKEKKFDLILSSYAPSASHEVALKLKKNYPNIKWIADMRDEMSLNLFLTKKQRDKLAVLEKSIFDYVDAITSVSMPILNDFKSLANTKAEKIKFCEIRNGYDFEVNNMKIKNEIFTISYVGSFYGERNPNNFLKALSNISKKIENFNINFIGTIKPVSIPNHLKSYVKTFQKVSHDAAIDYMKQSDALLLIHPSSSGKGVYTGKLFEYLAIQKPIIALVDPNDVAAKLIRDTNAGLIADNSDIKLIEEIILKIYYEYNTEFERHYNVNLIKKHHRKEQAKRLEILIEELVDE